MLSSSSVGGTWTSSSSSVASIGSVSGIITGIDTGTVIISYNMGSACYLTTTITVNPSPLPISGPGTVCAGGSTILLTDTATGGLWVSSNRLVATAGSVSGIITGVSAGTVVISYTLGLGCTITTTVVVNPLPSIIVGGASLCVGLNVYLADATPGGTWFSSNASVATVGSLSAIVSGISAGTSIITYQIPTGCLATFLVIVNPLPPPIMGTYQVCERGAATLTNTSSGGTWASGNTTIATIGISTGIVGGIAPGTTSITYTLATGCSTVITLTVNPSPVPITGLTTICRGGSASLIEPGSGTWSSSIPGVATVGAVSGLLSGISSGTSTVSFTAPNTCFATTVATVLASPSSIYGVKNLCLGRNTSLYDSVTGGGWTSANPAIATIHPITGIATGISVGTTLITYMLLTRCYTIDTITINPLPGAITGLLRACVGSNSSLSNFSPGGHWSSSNTAIASIGSTSGICSGISSGTTIITYTLAAGCYTTATFTVNNLPAPITGPTSLCVGSNINLLDATSGGTWTSSNPSVAIINYFSGVITGMSLGTTIVTYTLPGGCFTTSTISVTPSPSAITGPLTVCTGSTIPLTNAISGGSWLSSNTLIATIGTLSGIVTGITAGTCTITYSLGSGCNAYKTIAVKSSPLAIAGIPALCLGQTTVFTNPSIGGTWSSYAVTASIDSHSGLVTGLSAGTANITYTLPSGCYATTTIAITPAPTAMTGP